MSDSTVDHSLSRKAKDVAAGFIGGATQVLIGQPADLVKIRLQTSNETSSLSVIKHVVKNEGLLAFYKGTLAPLFGVGVCVSLQFYGFHEAKRQMVKSNGGSDLNLWPQTYIAGAVAGLVNSPVTAPIEQLRILSQSDTSPGKKSLTGMVSKIYRSHGLAGIYRGLGITVVRDMQAYGVWFLTYETLIQQIIGLQHYRSRSDISTPELLASGALAGNALWLLSYPIDVIKSNIQSEPFGPNASINGSIKKATFSIYKSRGLAGFWRGLVPCLLRAVPCSAGTFASVELALRLMG